ncbi:MAG: metal-dependent hydrolase [Candidatus Pacearchaeota archaeon]|nr:metal-dependent hydrolase [Candidatus Pacearchaeota archaeon]
MANGATHYAVGAMTGLAMAINGQQKDEPVDSLSVIATSTVFAKLPDILEPAIHPHHRQFFHSIAFLALLGYGLKKAYEWQPEERGSRILRYVALCAGAGYISHLVLDGLTPRSLPLIGKL